MGGGAANAPIASVIMVCELTGNYELLAPLMLSSVIHIYLSKNWSIYQNQVHNKFHSKAHKQDMRQDVLKAVQVKEIMEEAETPQCVKPECGLPELMKLMANTTQISSP